MASNWVAVFKLFILIRNALVLSVSVVFKDDKPRDDKAKLIPERDILIFMDGLATDLRFDDARIIFLAHNQGFGELAIKIKNRDYAVQGFKLIILMVGRGNAWDPNRVFFKGVEQVLGELETQNKKGIIVLCTTLPSIQDT